MFKLFSKKLDKTSVSFESILSDECQYINSRREQLAAANLLPDTESKKEQSEDNPSASSPEDLVGLAISGGGIRSATFGLGILQGLAQLRLLPRIDYLSTVSGGGYIGSWLSAWIRTSGFEQANEALLPARDREQMGQSWESERIKHLRHYSNYLVPIPGIFSIDGWTILAIFIRNLFLNLSVFILALFGVFCFLRIIVEWYSKIGNTAVSGDIWFGSGQSLLALGLGISALVTFHLLSKTKNALSGKQHQYVPVSQLFYAKLWILFNGIFGSLIFTTPFFYGAALRAEFSALFFWSWVGWSSFYNGLLGFALMNQQWRGLAMGSIAGSLGGAVTYFVMALVLSFSSSIQIAVAATFYVSLLIGCNVFINYLHVGIMGTWLEEHEREWWSRINAESVYFGVLWLFFIGLTVFGPWLVVSVKEHVWSIYVVGGGWVGTTLVGILTAKSKDTHDEKIQGVKSFLARIAPYVFLTGMLALVATAATWLMYDAQDWFVTTRRVDRDPESFLSQTALELLADLNNQKMDLRKEPYRITAIDGLTAGMLLFLGVSFLLAHRIGLNRFTLHNMYANRLVRCYLGAVRERQPNAISNFDPADDLPLASLATTGAGAPDKKFIPGPLHIINAAINCRVGDVVQGTEAGSLGLRDRLADSFVFTPLHTGSEKTGYCITENFAGKLMLGTAMSVSGAAVSPNMGFHTSPAVTALLTLFNLRLGAWFGNPAHDSTAKIVNPSNWAFMFRELLGLTDFESKYVYISDGGHFENMGVYELLRRRSRFIIACDAGADNNSLCQNLGYLIRKARMDFGIRIDIDVRETLRKPDGMCGAHVALGRIRYGDVHPPTKDGTEPSLGDPGYHYEDNEGILVYIKTGLTGDEPIDLLNYRAENPDFPDESTIDQFFSESQFESYRVLGLHSIVNLFDGVKFRAKGGERVVMYMYDAEGAKGASGEEPAPPPQSATDFWAINDKRTDRKLSQATSRMIFEDLYDHWLTNPISDSNAADYASTFLKINEDLATNPDLQQLANELLGHDLNIETNAERDSTAAERLILTRMTYFLQTLWIERKLHRHGLHPVNRGWIHIIKQWTQAPAFRLHWSECHEQFDPTFSKFIVYMQSQPL